MYFDSVLNFYKHYFFKFSIVPEITVKTMIIWGFYGFHHKNEILANFRYDFRNQRVKIHK